MKRRNPFKIIFSFPFTWLVILLITIVHIGFNYWFRPPLFFNLIGFGVDLFLLGLWFPLVLRSRSFRKQFNTMPYEKQSKEILHSLADCPDSFKTPAVRSLELIENINKEFTNQDYQVEIGLLVSNIYQLTGNHKRLYKRFQTFGTPDQKQQMKKMLDQQVGSMQKILNTLQTFSGNMTILAANTEKAVEATNELKYINEGLKEVIQAEF